MPYVEQEKRPDLDAIVKLMKKKNIKANGDLNYILVKYCKEHIPKNYNSLKNFLGELNEVIAEVRRKILSDYEDLKEKENGVI